VADDPADLRCELAQPLVVARLARDVGKQVGEPLACGPQEAPLLRVAEQDLRDRQGDELRIGDLRASSCTSPCRQEIVDEHVKCDQKVVKVGEHEATSTVDVANATPTFDDLPTSPRSTTAAAAPRGAYTVRSDREPF
jgi:hypothetical protein